jgi:hypothetical protein
MAREYPDIPHSMRKVYRCFEWWPGAHTARLPIPERLWSAAWREAGMEKQRHAKRRCATFAVRQPRPAQPPVKQFKNVTLTDSSCNLRMLPVAVARRFFSNASSTARPPAAARELAGYGPEDRARYGRALS